MVVVPEISVKMDAKEFVSPVIGIVRTLYECKKMGVICNGFFIIVPHFSAVHVR